MHRIVAVQPLDAYRVRIRFSDGVEGEVDLAPLVGKGVFNLWNDPEQFTKVFIDPESHAVAWPGGVDLCPDTLYLDVTAPETS